MPYRLIIFFVLIGLCGCNSQQRVSQLPEPAWIQYRNGSSLILSGDIFWSLGYEGNDILDWVDEHIMFSIDSEPLTPLMILVDRLSLEPHLEVFDDQQNRLGSFPEVIEIFFPPPVTAGTYRIDLSILSTSGEVYSYSWDLVVAEE